MFAKTGCLYSYSRVEFKSFSSSYYKSEFDEKKVGIF